MYWIRFSLVVLIATVLNASSMLNVIALGGYNIRPDLLLVLLLLVLLLLVLLLLVLLLLVLFLLVLLLLVLLLLVL